MSYGVMIVFKNAYSATCRIEMQVKDEIPFATFCAAMAEQGVHYNAVEPGKEKLKGTSADGLILDMFDHSFRPVEAGGAKRTPMWIPPHQIMGAWVSVDKKTGE